MTKEIKLEKQKSQSFWGQAFSHFQKNKLAMGSFILLTMMVLASVLVPILSPYNIVSTNADITNQAPTAANLLGTDHLGRDMLVRFFYAGRISMGLALVVTFLTCTIGVVLGGISGFYGKAVDAIIMRVSEMFMSFPFLFTAIVVVGLLGNSIPTLIGTLVILSWPTICRIVRGQILALRDLEYMQACEALGISDFRRIFRHLLPNVLAYVIVYATLNMAGVILAETALSFLGLGIAPPTPSWGSMIQEALNATVMRERWWIWIPPGVAIFLVVMCFNLIGDGLRDAIDPKMKR